MPGQNHIKIGELISDAIKLNTIAYSNTQLQNTNIHLVNI